VLRYVGLEMNEWQELHYVLMLGLTILVPIFGWIFTHTIKEQHDAIEELRRTQERMNKTQEKDICDLRADVRSIREMLTEVAIQTRVTSSGDYHRE